VSDIRHLAANPGDRSSRCSAKQEISRAGL